MDKPGQVQDQKDQINSMQKSNQEKGPMLFKKIARYCATQMIDRVLQSIYKVYPNVRCAFFIPLQRTFR